MGRGISTVIRCGERQDDGLRRLADGFAAELGGEAHVQLYATPAGTHSYGWHYDVEEVFIIQALGVKDYYMRENTVALGRTVGEPLNFACVREEKTQTMQTRLIIGDWLYIPCRWWHFVHCAEDALSISVGVSAL